MSEGVDLDEVRGGIPLTHAQRSQIRYLKFDALLSQPVHDLSEATSVGYQRVLFRGLKASNCATSLLFLPVGQKSPPHASNSEHIITVLEGAVIFRTSDSQFLLRRLDQLFIPARVTYEYFNSALESSYLLSVMGRERDWPAPPNVYKSTVKD